MAKQKRSLKWSPAFICCVIFVSACVHSPTQTYHRKAIDAQLQYQEIDSHPFRLAVYRNNITDSNSLHIYIEGDGSPYFRTHITNTDPTANKPIALSLLRLDTSPALLLGRPCYHQFTRSEICADPKWWTTGRYSQEVVDALAKAIMKLSEPDQKITLVGFSGGGTLAMLIAKKLEGIERVVTINANLNIDAWTDDHGYSRLIHSLNPYEWLNQHTTFEQVHLIGLADKNVNSKHWRPRLRDASNITVRQFPSFTHTCCWEKAWGEFLESNQTEVNP